MFLNAVLQRNPGLVDWAIWAHQNGHIAPDTYVIDVDVVEANAAKLAQQAKSLGVRLLQVMKQHGRNPYLVECIAAHIPEVAAIDFREVMVAGTTSASLGNVGHLVQIPPKQLAPIIRRGTRFITVYDVENLAAVNDAAASLNTPADVLLKIASSPETVYPGQEGGFEPDDVAQVLQADWSHARIVGLTAFPCVLFDPDQGGPVSTETVAKVEAASQSLREAGIDPILNLPSHTSFASLPLIRELGGTVAEPGHALTGTTPHHAHDLSLPEVPALVYVSQVAQVRTPSVFGGGFYPRGHASSLLVANASGKRVSAVLADHPAENIDYYRMFTADGPVQLGDTAVMSFRTQIFVTRSQVAILRGSASGAPRLEGTYDSQGRRL